MAQFNGQGMGNYMDVLNKARQRGEVRDLRGKAGRKKIKRTRTQAQSQPQPAQDSKEARLREKLRQEKLAKVAAPVTCSTDGMRSRGAF